MSIMLIFMTGCGSTKPLSWNQINQLFSEDKSKAEIPRNKDGEIEGAVKRYFRSGDLKSTTHYVNGKKHGIYKLYSPHYKRSEYLFNVIHDKVPTKSKKWKLSLDSKVNYINGLKEGDELWYDRDGKIHTVIPYKHSYKEGYVKFYTNGKEDVKERLLYRHGVDVKQNQLDNTKSQMIETHKKRVRECYKKSLNMGPSYREYCDTMAKRYY